MPEPNFAEDDRKKDSHPAFQPSDDRGSALHDKETEKEAIARVYNRVWNQMIPKKQPYDLKMRQIEEAYEGIVKEAKTNQESKVFPLVFLLVDAKLGTVLSNRPKAVFEIDAEKQKIPFIEHSYNHYTSDVDDGVNLEVVDHMWHWYNELYGWAVKRVWVEVDTEIYYEPCPKRDENDDYVFGPDGFVQMDNERKIFRKQRLKQRVYEYNKVAVDPAPGVMFLYQADDIVFIEDIHFNEFDQHYAHNPAFKNTEFVHAGKYYDHRGLDTTRGVDVSGNVATVFAGAANLNQDMVRIEEYYCRSRCEYMVKANNVPMLHVPNPTPLNWLPAADLHNRLRPGTFYSRGEGELAEPIIAIYQKLLNAKTRRAQLASAPVVLTSPNSALSPKSVKVYPGAHWKGMKGHAEVLNLSGQDTGEVSEYLLELRNLMKVVSGNDFERMIAEPDPTNGQQAARDAATRLRPEKDIRLGENTGHVRAMDLCVQWIQQFMTIPELAKIEDMSDEEKADLQSYDKINAVQYLKYPKIRTKGVRYVESYDESNRTLNLAPDSKNKGDGTFYGRPEFLRTRSRVRVRAVSDRSQTGNKQIKYEMQSDVLEKAFTLVPKNQADIDAALALQQPPPKPDYFINREEAVKGYIASIGGDVDQYTKPEGEDLKNKHAVKAIKALMDQRKPLMPNAQDLPQLSVPSPKAPRAPDILPQEALA